MPTLSLSLLGLAAGLWLLLSVAVLIGSTLVAHRLGLAAALFHVLNHALFKSLLFLSAGAVDMAVGTRDLERLGGLGQPGAFPARVIGPVSRQHE